MGTLVPHKRGSVRAHIFTLITMIVGGDMGIHVPVVVQLVGTPELALCTFKHEHMLIQHVFLQRQGVGSSEITLITSKVYPVHISGQSTVAVFIRFKAS